jgi:P4 family phage/plasmid primase-like protien
MAFYTNINDTRRAAERYLRAGLAVIPVAAGEKNPNRQGWQRERHTTEGIPHLWSNGQGVGILWGEPSGGMVDVDLDWPEARIAASYILPPTRTFGRPGAPESHRVYRVTDPIPKTTRYKIGGDGDDRSVVEVLSTGAQSLVPPSLHDSGEHREWYQERPAAEVESATLMDGVADSTTAALIARNWPGHGARHDYVLAATGYVARHLSRDRAERTMEAAIAASGDEEANGRLRDVQDTLEKVAADTPTTGGPTLDELAPGVVDQLQRWHRWSSKRHIEYGRRPIRSQISGAPAFNLTDLGNAERLVARHGNDLRYCYPWGKWLAWDGRRWAVDASGEVERRAVETVASIYTEAANADDKDERKAIARHAERSEARRAIDAMIALAKSRPGVPIMPDDLDADPWALNTASGPVDLRTGDLRAHDRSDLITKIIPVEYELDAQAPIFERFLERILPLEAVRGFLQRAVGYAATGVAREEMLPILHGPGANGKSTLTGVLLEVLGDYAIQAAPDLLMLKKGAHPTELADLFGARFVVCMENEEGRRLAESLVKHITGRDRIKARRMREDFWEFDPTHTVFLGTNHRPEVRGTDHAIWRRLKLIPFNVTIPEAEQDKTLPETLRSELRGILAWVVRGCIEYQRSGLGEPDQVRDATRGYRSDMDALAAFFEDRCVIHPRAEVPATQLYKAYQEWCAESGESDESQRRFGGRLQERGFVSFRYTAGPHRDRKGWRGIGLRDDHHADAPGGSEGPPQSSAQPEDRSLTADEHNRTNSAERDQGVHKAAKSGDDRPQSGHTADNRPHDEYPLGIEQVTEGADDADKRGLENDIDGSKPPHEVFMSKKGPHHPHRPQSALHSRQGNGTSVGNSTTGTSGSEAGTKASRLTLRDDSYASVEALFTDPPEWLPKQLKLYYQNPEKHIKPLCTAVAALVLGDGLRNDEVREEVERELARNP